MASTPETNEAVRRLGSYEIDGVVGHGLIGVIHEGRYVPGDRRVELEFIPADIADRGGLRQRLADAGRQVAVLTNRHLVRTYDLLEDGMALHVVTDPTEGALLTSISSGHVALTAADAVAIALDLLDALTTAHAADLTHGSIGSGCTVISASGEASLASLAVAHARTATAATVAVDIAAVCNLATALAPDALPGPVATVLSAARQVGAAAGSVREALAAAADQAFGKDWRASTSLAKAVSAAPKTAPAAAIAATSATFPRATQLPVTEPLHDTRPRPRRRRRWPWVTAMVVVIIAVCGGLVAYGASHNWLTQITHSGPLALSGPVSLTATPASGGCSTTYLFTASGTLTGTGSLVYQWSRSDGWHTNPTTLHISSSEGSFKLVTSWLVQGHQNLDTTMTFSVLKPATHTRSQTVKYSC